MPPLEKVSASPLSSRAKAPARSAGRAGQPEAAVTMIEITKYVASRLGSPASSEARGPSVAVTPEMAVIPPKYAGMSSADQRMAPSVQARSRKRKPSGDRAMFTRAAHQARRTRSWKSWSRLRPGNGPASPAVAPAMNRIPAGIA